MLAVCLGLPPPSAAASVLASPQQTEVWTPVPPKVASSANGIPSDAIVLFDGRNLDAWESAKTRGKPAPWQLDSGAMVVAPKTGDLRTKQSFGDLQLHLEFQTPARVAGEGQHRGNSGVFFMDRYELQILDSYENTTYANGQAASIYKQHLPLVNAARPPGEWQTFDVVFIAPRFTDDGRLLRPARMTVFHNGVLVHHDAVLQGATTHRGKPAYEAHPARQPLRLQDHGHPVAFRNLWAREIALPAAK